ncbi:MAG: cobalamin-dependent protein [Acidimicrobiia bacterium]
MDEGSLRSARLGVTAAALSGDSGGLYNIVARLMDEGIPLDSLLFDLLLPTERDVGSRWQSGDYLVSEEHTATATVETVVALLAGSLDQPEEGLHVVVASAEGDSHSLAGRAVAAYLLYNGFRTNFLGANVLASDLGEFLASEQPDALIISCAMTNHLLGARAVISQSHSADVPVLAGGRAFGETEAWATKLGADAWASHPRDIPGILQTWVPDVRASESRARDPSQDLLKLIERRTSVLALAQEDLERRLEKAPGPRLRDELALLLGAVEASLLLGENELIVETLEWQQTTLQAHGYGDSAPLTEAVIAGLRPVSPEAAEALRSALST